MFAFRKNLIFFSFVSQLLSLYIFYLQSHKTLKQHRATTDFLWLLWFFKSHNIHSPKYSLHFIKKSLCTNLFVCLLLWFVNSSHFKPTFLHALTPYPGKVTATLFKTNDMENVLELLYLLFSLSLYKSHIRAHYRTWRSIKHTPAIWGLKIIVEIRNSELISIAWVHRNVF